MNIILIGGPGSGKGTQSEYIVKKHKIAHVSTGNILRERVSGGTELGKAASAYMERGELVPDGIIVEMIEDRLSERDCAGGFLLDGFPRTVVQADELGKMLKRIGVKLDKVVEIRVGEEELKRRLMGRREKEGRTDDNAKTIENRLKVYKEQTKPLISYYRGLGLLEGVDGEGEIKEIMDRIDKVLE